MREFISQIDFGNEAADDTDAEELASYFVEQEMFLKFIDPKHHILVVTARKGVGKSALLQWASRKVTDREDDPLVIQCRGADLVRSKFNLTTPLNTPNDHIRDWMVRICALVNRQLAMDVGLAVKDDEIAQFLVSRQ